MRINLPDTVNQLKLGQMMAISFFIDLYTKKELSEAEGVMMDNIVSEFAGITVKSVRKLTQGNKTLILAEMLKLYAPMMLRLGEIMTQVEASTVLKVDKRPLFLQRILSSKWYFRFNKTRYTIKHPERLPARIWQRLLDKPLKRIGEVLNTEQRHKIVKEIPFVLACVCWSTEKVMTKDVAGQPEINFRAIEEKQQLFQEANGIDAFRAFAFFLITTNGSYQSPNITFYRSLLNTLSTKRQRGEKTMRKNGVG